MPCAKPRPKAENSSPRFPIQTIQKLRAVSTSEPTPARPQALSAQVMPSGRREPKSLVEFAPRTLVGTALVPLRQHQLRIG
jgi:hypothetical protein